MSDRDFQDLVERLRANDPLAAAEFLKLYEPEIKRIIKVRLFRDTRMRRLVDSIDVCQSVWLGFFKALAELQLEDEQKVLHLLGVIAQRKVDEHYRRAGARCRDFQRQAPGEGRELEVPAKGSSPSQHLAMQELREEFIRRMSPRERELTLSGPSGLWLFIPKGLWRRRPGKMGAWTSGGSRTVAPFRVVAAGFRKARAR